MLYNRHREIKHELADDNVLHVITVISNPCRYILRYKLYEEFAKRMLATKCVHLITVEAAFGNRQFEVTSPDNPDHIQVRHNTELWIKENLINIGMRALPQKWKYVAWVDADVTFLSDHWAQECLHALQTHPVVQPFSTAVDMGPHGEALQTHSSFGMLYATGKPFQRSGYGPYSFAHPGFAMAYRREFIENVRGLLDCGVLGSSDHHTALGIIGDAKYSMPGGLHPMYVCRVMKWQERALRAGHKDMGYTEGGILHHWHGPKKARGYTTRWNIIKKNNFDPENDVYYNQDGVLELSGNKPQFRNDIRKYFRDRKEDRLDND